jgi:hypothetical protein
MRINELIVENQQIDEISLAGVGKGVGNIIRGTSSAVQGAKGAWQGAKDAWAQGKATGSANNARAAVSGQPTPGAAPVQQAPQVPSTQQTPTPGAAPATSPTRANTRVPINVAKQDVDQAVAAVTKVRSRDRQNVVKYAKDKIDALQAAPAPAVEGAIYSNFLGQMI